MLRALGAGPDPEGWVVWGEEPGIRYTIFVPSPAGLIARLRPGQRPGRGSAGEREARPLEPLQLGELAIETQGGHRLLSFQVEGQILKGADAKADRVARFALELLAAIDGRELPPEPSAKGGAAGRRRHR